MGNWFIFQYHFWFYGMTHEVKPGRATVAPVKAVSYSRWRKRLEASGNSEWSYGKAKRA